jgi:predicted peptidase
MISWRCISTEESIFFFCHQRNSWRCDHSFTVEWDRQKTSVIFSLTLFYFVEFTTDSKNTSEYNTGNRSESDVIAAERWLSVMPIAPNVTVPDGVPEWDLNALMTIVQGVQAQYGTDPNRIYVSGYSMVCAASILRFFLYEQVLSLTRWSTAIQGARAIWKLLDAQPNTFAAAAMSAGEPNVTTTNFRAFANVPARHYVGSQSVPPSFRPLLYS